MRLTSKGHQALQETIAWTGALVAFSGIYYVLYGRKTPKETGTCNARNKCHFD